MRKDGTIRIPSTLVGTAIDYRYGNYSEDVVPEIQVSLVDFKRKSALKSGTFYQGMQMGSLLRAKLKLSQHENWVLDACVAFMEWENWIEVTQAVIASELGIGQADVSRAVKKLKGKGLLLEEATQSGRKRLRVNAAIAWKGKTNKTSGYSEVLKRHEDAITVVLFKSSEPVVSLPPQEPGIA